MKDDSFFDKVYHITRLIPYGRVSSYGAIAKYLGAARSARMVGWALNGTKTKGMDVPAHRVVNRNGLLTGKQHFGQKSLMQELLESEGIEIIDDQIQKFSEVHWDPVTELRF
ncbi:MAG: methylated-DNA--[protein]-cysteine S-methyltransferase [Bacteroidales bacterium]|nr:methylated-DNA--[protein]-cysteine S-methyltransferase [Bacteroidales bacterium]